MTGLAFSLVIVAAFVHASWNFLTKLVNSKGTALVWLFSIFTSIIYLPLNLYLILDFVEKLDSKAYIFMFGSFVLHLAYFLMLQAGYRSGDLSIVYPVARGTGPMLSTIAAILFLGEMPTFLAILGALLVVSGVFFLSGGIKAMTGKALSRTIVFGLLTGSIIASYTVWDKVAVSTILIPPLLLDYSSAIGRTITIAPFALRERDEIKRLWNNFRWHVVGIAILNPLSYILILTAMTFSPVSYIAPAREVSTLIAVLMGIFILKEGQLKQKLSASLLIMIGVILLALN